MLEVNLAQPLWLRGVPPVLVVLVFLSLVASPPWWPYALAVILFCLAAMWRFYRMCRLRDRHRTLRVWSSGALAVVDFRGAEHAVPTPLNLWVSRNLVVLQLQVTGGRTEAIAVSRQVNDPDSFRRFSVMCRNQFAVAGSEGQNVSATQHQRSMS